MEVELVKRAGVPFEAIPAAGVHGVGLRALPGNTIRLMRGYRSARNILDRFQPDALLFTGGYVAVPMALAGRKTPAVLFVPDIEPGLALKVLARFADRIAVSAEESRAFFPTRSDVTVTGYPTRPELRPIPREKARAEFGINTGLPILMVFGGSSGARSINRALLAKLPDLLEEMNIIHISGRLDWEQVSGERERLKSRLGERASLAERYQVFPYLHEEMGVALSAADLVLSRAGASALGELPLFGSPAILVPYPHAWRYQMVNAEYLAQHGAAVIVADQDLPEKLVEVVIDLIGDREKLEGMHRAMSALARPEAAPAIAELLRQLASKVGQKRK